MQIGVTSSELSALVEAVPVLGNNTLLYVLDPTQTNVVAFTSIAYGTETLVVTITDTMTLAAFTTLFAGRNVLPVSSLSA